MREVRASSDPRAAVYDAEGLDAAALIERKDKGGTVAEYPEGTRLDRDAVVGIAA